MSDNGRLEAHTDWLRAQREAGDLSRLRVGVRVARLMRESMYGEGVVRELARDAGYGRSTLYEYADVMRFLVAWQGLSARRTFENHPMLTYSHLRRAMRITDFEERIDALLQSEVEGLTPDEFGVYVSKLLGKTVPAPPLAEFQGWYTEVNRAWLTLRARLAGKRVKVTIRELQE